MGYRGKVAERQRARELRARSWTLQEIADELGVSKSSVSLWVREVDFEPRPRNRGHPAGPHHPMRQKKEAEIVAARAEAVERVGEVTDRDLLVFALALYAGEGGKSEGAVIFANSDPVLIRVFLRWLRSEFDLDEERFRGRLYLHTDLDLAVATEFWSELSGIPPERFHRPYRAAADPTMRRNRHERGCFTVKYHSRSVQRRVMARIRAIGSALALPG
jgi:hypothetical protein